MLLLTRLALRNLLRHWRRTLFTVCTLSVGVMLSIWTDNITKGRADDIVNTVTQAYVGHYQISTANFRKDELIQDYIQNLDVPNLAKEFDLPVSPRIHFPVLLSSGENSLPIVLDGIVPEQEDQVTHLSQKVTTGEYLQTARTTTSSSTEVRAPTSAEQAAAPEGSNSCAEREILISQDQSEKLNVGIGDKVVIVGPATDGTLGNDLYRVRGIYKTDSKAFDRKVSFANFDCVAATGQINGPHELVFASKTSEDPVEEKQIKDWAAKNNLLFSTWRESVPQLYSIVRFSQAIHNAINFILFLVISAGIVNVMLMTIYERTREFGVMSALGTRARQMVSLVLIETFGIGAMGLLFGAILGSGLVMYHHFYGFDLHFFLGKQYSAGDFNLSMVVKPDLSLMSIFRSGLITMGFMLLAGLYPSYQASRMTPIEAMRSH